MPLGRHLPPNYPAFSSPHIPNFCHHSFTCPQQLLPAGTIMGCTKQGNSGATGERPRRREEQGHSRGRLRPGREVFANLHAERGGLPRGGGNTAAALGRARVGGTSRGWLLGMPGSPAPVPARQEKPEGSQVTEPPLMWGGSAGIGVSRNNVYSQQKHEQLQHFHPQPTASSSPHGPTGRQAGHVGGAPRSCLKATWEQRGASQGRGSPAITSVTLRPVSNPIVSSCLYKEDLKWKMKVPAGGRGRPPSLPAA